MTSKFLTSAAILAFTLGLAACDDNSALDNPPGEYKKTTSVTKSDGTSVTQEKTTKVDVDSEGNKKATVKTQTTTDPEGLLNQKTTTRTEEIEEDRY